MERNKGSFNVKVKVFDMTRYSKGNVSEVISVVALINLLLAITAMVKDMFFASYLGTSIEGDALLNAFFITDMIGYQLIASAAGVSTVPFFSKVYGDKGSRGLNKSLAGINILIFVLSFTVLILLYVFKTPIAYLLGEGLSVSTNELSSNLIKSLLPIIVLYPIAFVGISAMQVREKFVVSSLAPVLFNFIFLAGIIYCYLSNMLISKGVYIVALSIVVGVLSMVILIYMAQYNHYKLALEDLRTVRKELKDFVPVMKMFAAILIIIFLSQSAAFIERNLASSFSSGSVSALNYAYRLSQFPVWVFVSAIATVTFPKMSMHYNKDNINELNNTLERGIWMITIITMPIVIFLYTLRAPLISTLFLRGAFNYDSLAITTSIFAGYCTAIIWQSITAMYLKFSLSIGKILEPTLIFLVSMLVTIVTDLYFIKIFGLQGLGFGAACGSFTSAVLLF